MSRGRELTAGELKVVSDVFVIRNAVGGQTSLVDFSRVRIHPYNGHHLTAGSPSAPNGHIYLPPSYRLTPAERNDMSTSAAGRALLIHEMTHVWQFQGGVKVVDAYVRGLVDTEFTLNTDHRIGDLYDYSDKISEPFRDWSIEEQAMFVQHYYMTNFDNARTDTIVYTPEIPKSWIVQGSRRGKVVDIHLQSAEWYRLSFFATVGGGMDPSSGKYGNLMGLLQATAGGPYSLDEDGLSRSELDKLLNREHSSLLERDSSYRLAWERFERQERHVKRTNEGRDQFGSFTGHGTNSVDAWFGMMQGYVHPDEYNATYGDGNPNENPVRRGGFGSEIGDTFKVFQGEMTQMEYDQKWKSHKELARENDNKGYGDNHTDRVRDKYRKRGRDYWRVKRGEMSKDEYEKKWDKKYKDSKPIVVDLDGDGVELKNSMAGVSYDWDKDGFAEATGWVAADDGLVVYDDGTLDADGKGTITAEDVMLARFAEGVTYHEIDGETKLKKSPTDFDGFKMFDVNGDGVLDADDKGQSITISVKGEWDSKLNDGDGGWVKEADGSIKRSDIGKYLTYGDLLAAGEITEYAHGQTEDTVVTSTMDPKDSWAANDNISLQVQSAA